MEAPPRAVVDNLELEPARHVSDDEGPRCRESADLAGSIVEGAPALGMRHRPCRRGVTVPEVAEPSEHPVAPGRALQAIDLMGPEWDEDAGSHGCLLNKRRCVG